MKPYVSFSRTFSTYGTPPPPGIFEKNCSRTLFHNSFHTDSRKLHYRNWSASWSSGQGLWLLIMRSRVRFPVLPCEFSPCRERFPVVTMVWVVSRFRLKAPPGISSSCISPLTSSGQRSRASWASQPQKSATLSPQPREKSRKFIRTCGGIGEKRRLPRIKKYYFRTGRRNHGRPLKKLLGAWDRNGSTSGPTPWQIYDDDDDGSLYNKYKQTVQLVGSEIICVLIRTLHGRYTTPNIVPVFRFILISTNLMH